MSIEMFVSVYMFILSFLFFSDFVFKGSGITTVKSHRFSKKYRRK